MAACGADASRTAGAGGADGSGGSGASAGSGGAGLSGPLPAACPATPPADGAPCTAIGQWCEYGDDVDWTCNVVMVCEVSGVWQPQLESAPGCSTKPFAPCAGGQCAAADELCEIPTGLCGWGEVPTGPGQQTSTLCVCGHPDPGCPAWPARPRLGSACSPPDLFCGYAPCDSRFNFSCIDGEWVSPVVLQDCNLDHV